MQDYNMLMSSSIPFISCVSAFPHILLLHCWWTTTEREREREQTGLVWSASACIQLLTCGVFQLSYFVIKKNCELNSKIWLRMNQWKQKTLQVWTQTLRKGRKELSNFRVNFVMKHMVPSLREYSGNIIVFTSDNKCIGFYVE